MPIPKKRKNEEVGKFIARCMSDPIMNKEYPNKDQRYAICQTRTKSTIADEVCDILSKAKKLYEYQNPKTGETYFFDTRKNRSKDGTMLVYVGEATEK